MIEKRLLLLLLIVNGGLSNILYACHIYLSEYLQNFVEKKKIVFIGSL